MVQRAIRVVVVYEVLEVSACPLCMVIILVGGPRSLLWAREGQSPSCGGPEGPAELLDVVGVLAAVAMEPFGCLS